MSAPKITAAGEDAQPQAESTSWKEPHDPQHSPAVAMTWRQALDANQKPIHLTLEQSTRIRGRIDALVQVCDEIGVQVRVILRCVDEVSAFDLMPEGEQKLIRYSSPILGAVGYGVREHEVGVHAIDAYTGDVKDLPRRVVETAEDAS